MYTYNYMSSYTFIDTRCQEKLHEYLNLSILTIILTNIRV